MYPLIWNFNDCLEFLLNGLSRYADNEVLLVSMSNWSGMFVLFICGACFLSQCTTAVLMLDRGTLQLIGHFLALETVPWLPPLKIQLILEIHKPRRSAD